MQGPQQPATVAQMTESPPTDSVPVEAAAQEMTSPGLTEAGAAPSDNSLPVLGARIPHDPSNRSNVTADGSRQPHVRMSGAAPGSSTQPESASAGDSAAASSEVSRSPPSVVPAIEADGADKPGQGPRAPMRHYWGQVI